MNPKESTSRVDNEAVALLGWPFGPRQSHRHFAKAKCVRTLRSQERGHPIRMRSDTRALAGRVRTHDSERLSAYSAVDLLR